MPNSPYKNPGENSYKHAQGCGDLFVTFFEHVDDWVYKPYLDGKIKPDMKMVIQGKTLYLEFDRGSEDIKDKIIPKIEAYINYSLANKEQKFYVLFSVAENKVTKTTDLKRIEKILNTLYSMIHKMRAYQFWVAFHKFIIDAPFDQQLFNINNEKFSINELK